VFQGALREQQRVEATDAEAPMASPCVVRVLPDLLADGS